MNLDQRAPESALDDNERQRLRVAIWLVLGSAVLALSGIFGFGALTGAGDYFSDDEAEKAAAIADHYGQIWGILLPVAIASVVSGVALFVFAGPLTRILSGWRATVVEWVRRIIIPLSVGASVPYWFGPEFDELDIPGWVEVVSLILGVLTSAATIALGVAMLVRPLPRWTGIAMIIGAVLAVVLFLPLFIFVGTLAASVGLLRWSRALDRSSSPAIDATATA